jgi:hypothetical protein
MEGHANRSRRNGARLEPNRIFIPLLGFLILLFYFAWPGPGARVSCLEPHFGALQQELG